MGLWDHVSGWFMPPYALSPYANTTLSPVVVISRGISAAALRGVTWEDCEPTCDICGEQQDGDPDWNGETGNHESCEASLRARREPHPREFAVRDVSTCNCDACTMVPEVPE